VTEAGDRCAETGEARAAWAHDHSRAFHDFTYVYPVISRRSDGLSIGINLNLDRLCNFDCIYCQVDRRRRVTRHPIDLAVLQDELNTLIQMVVSGAIWRETRLASVPAAMHRLDNIAFSGDGEPTLCRWFEQAAAVVAAARVRWKLSDVKIVLITNASNLRDPGVEHAVHLLDVHGGEVWAKLDAGSESQFRRINRASVPFAVILENLLAAGRLREIVIQTMVMRMGAEQVSEGAFDEYLDTIERLRQGGCHIRRVQLYTVARAPREETVRALSDAELDALAERLRRRLPELPVQVTYANP
jgi:wyosine [tRNA(Phe)-imidazoG37] synthetase (radical SAM superfamily)